MGCLQGCMIECIIAAMCVRQGWRKCGAWQLKRLEAERVGWQLTALARRQAAATAAAAAADITAHKPRPLLLDLHACIALADAPE